MILDFVYNIKKKQYNMYMTNNIIEVELHE